jgi:hypothetical protein
MRTTPAATCVSCLAWGAVFAHGMCAACYMFARKHPVEECQGCRRRQPVRKGYCRLCWCQARADARASGRTDPPATAADFLSQVGAWHQLFLADLLVIRGAATTSPAKGYGRRGRPRTPPPPVAVRPTPRWVQPPLFAEVRRDFTRFDEQRDPDPTNPWLAWANHLAHRRAESRGWSVSMRTAVRRGLVIILSHHVDGDTVRYSEMFPALRALNISVERIAEVLVEMNLLTDDRPRAFDGWVERKLDGLAPGIARDVGAWLGVLHDGGSRSRARAPATAYNHMNNARPVLLAWSAHHDHLREVIRDEIVEAIDALHGSRRDNVLVALRSLFAFCRKNGTIFRDPTRGIKVGQHPYGVIQPLREADIGQAVAAATTPAAKLVIVLAAVHAARTTAIRQVLLDDVDLGNRRLVINSQIRPLDDLTHRVLTDWLTHRGARWPNTANPHLLINQQTAMGSGPVSTFWAKKTLRGYAATLERLRIDRQLEEALVHGPDPLHLAAVFGMDPKTAIRYADSARQLLQTAAEGPSPDGSTRTQGQNPSNDREPT